MALYTPLSDEELAALCARWQLGALREAVGIPQGSINTNYRLETERGRFFLRHTTVRSADDLRYEAALLAHLEESHFPAPRLLTANGETFHPLRGGFVSIFRYLVGEELTRAQLTPLHLENLGSELAKMHRVLLSFSGQRGNPYGAETVRGWIEGLARRSDAELGPVARELDAGLAEAVAAEGSLVPRGTIHADLFMDNVKWVGDRVSAFFDFEMACEGPLTLDFAITLNAWCFDDVYRPELCSAFTRGYQRERKLSDAERADLWSRALFGAVRYTASRIRDFHLSTLPPDRLARKDFRTYLARTRALREMGELGFERLLG